MSTTTPESRPAVLLGLALTIVAAGGMLGAIMNAINGAISPEYFRSVMRWDDVEAIWRASLALGIFAGLVHGIVFSVILTLVVGRVSGARCTYAFAVRQLVSIVAGVCGCWMVGGLVGVGLAALSPDFFQRTFIRVPETLGPMLRYAWVGGSIFGAGAGAVLGLVIGSFLFAARWRRWHAAREAAGETGSPGGQR